MLVPFDLAAVGTPGVCIIVAPTNPGVAAFFCIALCHQTIMVKCAWPSYPVERHWLHPIYVVAALLVGLAVK